MKIYIFGGSKDEPDWYFTPCKLSRPYIRWSKKYRRLRCWFFADQVCSCDAFYALSLKQLLFLPFKHRLYFSERRAKEQQRRNYYLKEVLQMEVAHDGRRPWDRRVMNSPKRSIKNRIRKGCNRFHDCGNAKEWDICWVCRRWAKEDA